VDERIEDWDRQYGSIAFRDLPQDRNLGFVEFGQGDDEELFDLVGIRTECLARLGPDDDGRHSKARSRRIVIELSEYVRVAELEPDLFVSLAEGGFDDRLVGIEAAARKRELA
jgi:hypothetical protein